jgi:hypothetical protein
MAEEESLSLAPFGELIQTLIKIPQEVIAGTTPNIQQQIKELPDIVKMNTRHVMQQLQEIPNALTKQAKDLSKAGFPVQTTIAAASPIPLLSKDDIDKIQKASDQAAKDAQVKGNTGGSQA